MSTTSLTNLTNPSPWRCSFLLVTLVLGCFALSPTTRAQLPSPAPDGGYPGFNTAEGDGALFSLTTGAVNTATGFQALFSNTTGGDNTANGTQALLLSTTGSDNTATGAFALENNTTGINNTANGSGALFSNNIGDNNTANGFQALYSNKVGGNNTANGFQSLFSNTTGDFNTATGFWALYYNTIGEGNTANGFQALFNNTGGGNTADGFHALFNNTGGFFNTANGEGALNASTIGGNNTADGLNALASNTTGSSNIGLGVGAGDNLTTGSNNIDIGNQGVAAEANTVRIGTQGTQTATYIAGIMGKTTPKGMPVFINANGQLGTATSSERFKDAIKPMDKASEAILALKPVTFHYKKEIDPEGIAQFGLVAEDVAKVNPDLVARDADGKIYTVRYDAVNAMLLNEFLKEHRKNQEQEATIAKQQKQIDALRDGLQKVSAQIEVTKPAPQIVDNHQ